MRDKRREETRKKVNEGSKYRDFEEAYFCGCRYFRTVIVTFADCLPVCLCLARPSVSASACLFILSV